MTAIVSGGNGKAQAESQIPRYTPAAICRGTGFRLNGGEVLDLPKMAIPTSLTL
jgi:hypothetical protein